MDWKGLGNLKSNIDYSVNSNVDEKGLGKISNMDQKGLDSLK